MEPIIVFLGEFTGENLTWNELGRNVGWGVQKAKTVDGLEALKDRFDVIAVFVDCSSDICLSHHLRAVRTHLPGAKIVVCYPLCTPVLADELIAAGAFHSVPKPLNHGEVKQSIGFAWESWTRARRVKTLRASAA